MKRLIDISQTICDYYNREHYDFQSFIAFNNDNTIQIFTLNKNKTQTIELI